MLLRALIAALFVLALAAGPALGADPRRDEQWGLEMVKGVEAWSTSTGVGSVVAVIDTGVQATHPELRDRLVGGYDFVGDDPFEKGDEDADPNDGNGHGTHVAGIAVATAENGEGIAGVAPGARVMPIRVLDDDGSGFVSDVIKGIDYAIEHGAHVINLSLGGEVPIRSELLDDPKYADALERAVSKGIVVVVAAGNSSAPQCESPLVPGTLCVGAVDPRRSRSAFSSFGQGVHVVAPGGSGLGGSSEDVLSTYTPSPNALLPSSRCRSACYASVAGTSQATPHVAAVAALLVSVGVRGRDTVDRIIATAADPGAPVEDGQYGSGIVDAAAAVDGLAPPPPPPPPGPGDSDPPPPPPPAATGSYSTAKSVRARTVRRHGFRVKCKAARPGPCKLAVRYRGKKIAGGRADVPADLATRVTARLNRRGKKKLKGLRRKIRVRLVVTLPGEAARSRRITVRR